MGLKGFRTYLSAKLVFLPWAIFERKKFFDILTAFLMVYSAEVSGMIGQLGKNIMKYSLHFIAKILHREYKI